MIGSDILGLASFNKNEWQYLDRASEIKQSKPDPAVDFATTNGQMGEEGHVLACWLLQRRCLGASLSFPFTIS